MKGATCADYSKSNASLLRRSAKPFGNGSADLRKRNALDFKLSANWQAGRQAYPGLGYGQPYQQVQKILESKKSDT